MLDYYETMYPRRNRLKESIYNFFFGISSFPRMLLETLIRHNLGERYFSFSGAMFLFTVLGLYPILISIDIEWLPWYLRNQDEFNFFEFLKHYLTWYAYLVLFFHSAVRRRDEIKHLPSIFDLARFSLSTGLMHPRLMEVAINGKRGNVRLISTLIEPGLFFLSGFILWLIGQAIGPLLIGCSIIYSLSYVASYHLADEWVMNMLDKIIIEQEFSHSVMDRLEAKETRGFSFMGRLPADEDLRNLIVQRSFTKTEIVEAI